MKYFFIIICLLGGVVCSGAQPLPLSVKGGHVVYGTTAKGNRMPDYSYCGYKESAVSIPDAPVVVYVPVKPGDNSKRIQKAIDYVSGLKVNKRTGLRGAVLLGEGTFTLTEPLRISASGVVLRGADKHKTILYKTGVQRGSAVYIEGRHDMRPADTLSVSTNYMPLNSRTLTINGHLNEGDNILIWRPSTKEWIEHLAMGNFGGGKDLGYWGWHPGDADVRWDRTVTKGGSSVELNAPLTMALDSHWGTTKVIKYAWPGRISDAGVENLTIQSSYDTQNTHDENHCWQGVYIDAARDCWVRKVSFKHLAGSAVAIENGASRITVEDCDAREPISELGGWRRRTFYTEGGQCLFQRCWSEEGINDFSAGYCAPGPNAFVQCESYNSMGFSGSTGMWATGLLFDCVTIDGHDLQIGNIGYDNYGSGWTTANSTLWQCSAANIYASDADSDACNVVYGCWADFHGTSFMAESNNHVQPWSLFAEQLSERLGHNADNITHTYVRNTTQSTSPTIEEAQRYTAMAHLPRVTMAMWMDSVKFTASVNGKGAKLVDALPNKVEPTVATPHYAITNGKITMDGELLVGGRSNAPWWNGRVRPSYYQKAPYALTRFVPGREGTGLTDRVDSVVAAMERSHTLLLNQNYGLWYDRRRDDHERVRRRDGNVFPPFYEQAFARSGKGKAWDGLSLYNLNKLNSWYFYRINDFAKKGAQKGLLLVNQHYFQHNILEAGAHWVDCPWRSANNINEKVFPEPVPFMGDKRIFMADYFYNVKNDTLRKYHKQYIFNTLDALADQPNIIQSIGEEFTGPYDFVKFWLQTIQQWEQARGKKVLVQLSCNKNVQDSILANSGLRNIVDIITIEQWFYHNKGLYAPDGGLNMAPRQYMRKIKAGVPQFGDVYRSVSEYRKAYPEKAVIYYASKYPELCWAAFMAGGSCPAIPVRDKQFLKDAALMQPSGAMGGVYMMENANRGAIVYIDADNKDASIDLKSGAYKLSKIDSKTGNITMVSKRLNINTTYSLHGKGIYWLEKL